MSEITKTIIHEGEETEAIVYVCANHPKTEIVLRKCPDGWYLFYITPKTTVNHYAYFPLRCGRTSAEYVCDIVARNTLESVNPIEYFRTYYA